jgi:hypothetical protein
LVDPIKRGHQRTTDTGRVALDFGIAKIDKTYLEKFGTF